MTKKKKHRKSNRSRKQRIQTQAASVNTDASTEANAVDNAVDVKADLVKKSTTKSSTSNNQIIYDDVELSYVKEDIRKTLILLGIILAVYTAIWLLMTYTSFGTQALHIFSR